MRTFFHCSTKKYEKRAAVVLTLSITPLVQCCIIVILTLMFNFRRLDQVTLLVPLLITCCSCILLGMIIAWVTLELKTRAVKRNARYTYLDIQLKAFVFSRYDGEFSFDGERVINRRLYTVDFEDFESARTEENALVIRGKIHYYKGMSHRMGYHIKDGKIDFDNWWYNLTGWEEITELRIENVFEKPALIAESLAAAKKRFDEIPPPKPYVFKEADFIRRRPKPRILPDDMNFNRQW